MTQSFIRNIPFPVTVPNGGTGAQTLTGVVTGNGTSPMTASPVTEGAVLLGGASNAVSDTGVLAKGDLLVGDGVTAPVLLNVGADDTVLTADSSETSGLKWAAGASSGGAFHAIEPNFTAYDDFIIASSGSNGWGWGTAVVGSASMSESGHIGVCEPGGNAINTGLGVFLGIGSITFESMAKWIAAPATGDAILMGLGDTGSATPANGIYFEYQYATGFWECITENTSTQTVTTTSIDSTANWHRFTIIVNAAGTSAEFYIDGVLEATHTTNLPSSATDLRAYHMGTSIAAGLWRLDYMSFNYDLTRT